MKWHIIKIKWTLFNQELKEVKIPYCSASQTISGVKDQVKNFFQSFVDHFFCKMKKTKQKNLKTKQRYGTVNER